MSKVLRNFRLIKLSNMLLRYYSINKTTTYFKLYNEGSIITEFYRNVSSSFNVLKRSSRKYVRKIFHYYLKLLTNKF
jgi:hypothetical protein